MTKVIRHTFRNAFDAAASRITYQGFGQFIDRAPHSIGVRVYSGKLAIEKTKTLAGKEFTLLNLPFYLINKLPEYLAYTEKMQKGNP